MGSRGFAINWRLLNNFSGLTLIELQLPPSSTTTPMPFVPSTAKAPRRKQQQHTSNKNNIPDVIKPKDYHITNPYMVDNEVIPAVESMCVEVESLRELSK